MRAQPGGQEPRAQIRPRSGPSCNHRSLALLPEGPPPRRPPSPGHPPRAPATAPRSAPPPRPPPCAARLDVLLRAKETRRGRARHARRLQRPGAAGAGGGSGQGSSREVIFWCRASASGAARASGPGGTKRFSRTSWITHFHISQEMMKSKKLGLRFILDRLTEHYDDMRDHSNNVFPEVYISKGKCSAGNDECFSDQTCCLTVVTEDDSNSTSQLDTIKKRVIPKLLAMLVKGFLEFKDVEIQCQQDNELVLKVGMSEHCKRGEFWTTLQNACVPIFELIDWERSRPGSVFDISCSYGVDSAWNFFVESLRSKTDDIGKKICREHLLVVADSLFVSGQFHGLSSQGLKQHRTRLSISSPFSEACFSRPAQSFINAAKQCSVDNLCGTVDAMAWGKEPFAGTSGPFEIMYSAKAHEPIPNENIYDVLHKLEVRDTTISNGGTISVEQNFLSARVGIWDNIIDMRTCLQNMVQIK